MLEGEDYAPPVPSQRRNIPEPLRRNPSPDMTLESHRRGSMMGSTLQVEVDQSQTRDPVASQEVESPPTSANPPEPSASQFLTQPSIAPIEFVGSPTNDNTGELPVLPPSPSPAPVVIPSNPRNRTSSGHSHSLIRPSLMPQSPLRRPDSVQSTHSSRPSTVISHLAGHPVAASPSSAKGFATTALADEAILHNSPIPPQLIALPATSDASSSPPVAGVLASRNSATPSPTASTSESLSNVLLSRSRKRTLSAKAPPVTGPGGLGLSAGALSSFANRWRIPLGRNGTESMPVKASDATSSDTEGDNGVSVTLQRGSNDARSLLRKLDTNGK